MREHYDIQKIIYKIKIYMNDSWNYVSKNGWIYRFPQEKYEMWNDITNISS